jgi:hypothetical protein
MVKKSPSFNFTIFFLFLIILLISIRFIISEEIPTKAVTGIDTEKLTDSFEKMRNLTESENKTGYLTSEWNKILANNTLAIKINSFGEKTTNVSRVLFGTYYSFSFTFLLTIILWLITLFNLPRIIKGGIGLSTELSLIISLIGVIVISQTKVFVLFSEFLIKAALYEKNTWTTSALGIVMIIAVVIILTYLEYILGKGLEYQRKQNIEIKANQGKKDIIILSNKIKEE